jgi:hypothetical protein
VGRQLWWMGVWRTTARMQTPPSRWLLLRVGLGSLGNGLDDDMTIDVTFDASVLTPSYRHLPVHRTLAGSDLPRPLREHEIRVLVVGYRKHLLAQLADGAPVTVAIASADAYLRQSVARLATFLHGVERRRAYWVEVIASESASLDRRAQSSTGCGDGRCHRGSS